MRATNPSALREKVQVLSFLPNVGSCAGDGVYSEIVSQPFLPSLMRFASCLLDVKGSLCQCLVFFQRNLFPVKQLQIPCVCGRRWVQDLSRHLELEPGEKDSKAKQIWGTLGKSHTGFLIIVFNINVCFLNLQERDTLFRVSQIWPKHPDVCTCVHARTSLGTISRDWWSNCGRQNAPQQCPWLYPRGKRTSQVWLSEGPWGCVGGDCLRLSGWVQSTHMSTWSRALPQPGSRRGSQRGEVGETQSRARVWCSMVGSEM